MADLLLVEDDATLALSVATALELEGHAVTAAGTLAEARARVAARRPDLVVLDLGLPDGDGMTLCAALRTRPDPVPVLVLTARGTLEARVAGLRGGADDYVTKPFDLPELLARVDALLRRARPAAAPERLRVGRLEVDLRRHEARRDGEPVEVTALELALLRYLAEHADRAIPREELLTAVWGVRGDTRTRTVDMFVSRLRRLVERDPAEPEHLLSVRGVGYLLRP